QSRRAHRRRRARARQAAATDRSRSLRAAPRPLAAHHHVVRWERECPQHRRVVGPHHALRHQRRGEVLMAWRRSFAAAAFVCMMHATTDAHANPPDTYGFGSRETAMGNAASADTHGFAASYYNPAALTRSHGLELSVGYFRADHHLEMNGQDN